MLCTIPVTPATSITSPRIKGWLTKIIIPLAILPRLSFSASAIAAPQAPSTVTSGAVGTCRQVSTTTKISRYSPYLMVLSRNLYTDSSSELLSSTLWATFSTSFVKSSPAARTSSAIRRLSPYCASLSHVFSVNIASFLLLSVRSCPSHSIHVKGCSLSVSAVQAFATYRVGYSA